MQLDLPWGETDQISLEIPESWDLKLIKGVEIKPISSFKEIFLFHLNNPIKSSSLSEMLGKLGEDSRIAIVIDDRTRPTPGALVLPILFEYLHKNKINTTQITVIFANGVHREMTEEEMIAKVGKPVYSSVKCINHNVDKLDELKKVGTMKGDIEVMINRHVVDAELVIIIGTIEVHGQAGFGGGLKMIIPGVAGREVINETHNFKYMNPDLMSQAGTSLEKNPMRQLINNFGMKALKQSFLINFVLDPVEPIQIFTGDVHHAHQAGVKYVNDLFGYSESLADILITSSYPLDADFRMGTKSLSAALNGLKPGGILCAFLRCEEGLGDVVLPNVNKIKGLALKVAPMQLIQKIVDKLDAPPDQSGGSMDLIKLCKYFHPFFYVPTLMAEPGIENLQNLGLQMYSDIDLMMKDVQLLLKKNSKINRISPLVVVTPNGGTTFAKPR